MYYIDNSIFCITWADCVEWSHDENGVRMVNYKNLYFLGIGKVYNPNFIDDINWFMNNFEDRGDYYLIPYNYNWFVFCDFLVCALEKPFYSCEGQGQALTVALEKYFKTKDEKFFKFAKKIFQSFVDSPLEEDYWLQGFYHRDIGGTYILNSQIFCLLDVYTFYELTEDPIALDIFNGGVKRLENEIDSYAAEGGTIYDKYNRNFKSHSEHPEYLDILSELAKKSKSTKLAEVHDKWIEDFEILAPR